MRPPEQPTSIDLILANTEEGRICLETTLGVTQEQMADFFYTRFFGDGLYTHFQGGGFPAHTPAQTSHQRLDAVKAVLRQMKSTASQS